MIKLIRKREFANGIVYAIETEDGYPIEVTSTYLPFYTKECINGHTNELTSGYLGDYNERYMIGVSVASGCPVRCKFCATGQLKKYRNLTAEEILEQVNFVINENKKNGFDPSNSKEFKINYTRMGEYSYNKIEIQKAIQMIDELMPFTHHFVSTIGIKGDNFDWIKDNITLQISVHSLDEEYRNWLIPIKNKMTLKELGQIRTNSGQKTTINLTLTNKEQLDVKRLKKYFDPQYFFIKLSPLNENLISDKNEIEGTIKVENLI